MRQAVLLGLRLARGSTGAARYRSLAMVVAALVGTVLLLVTAAFARAVWAELTADRFYRLRLDDVLSLVLVVLALVLTVGTLVSTVGRLSARLRDQRLTNLRLLGMTPGQTRAVAVTEAAVAAAVGWAAGEVLFAALRPSLPGLPLGGRHYTLEQLTPHVLDHLWVGLAVPGLVIALGALRPRRPGRELVQAGRRGADRRPGWWRLVPLALGAALCLWLGSVAQSAQDAGQALRSGDRLVVLMVVAVALVGVGVLLVLPVFVRLVADLLTRARDRPVLLVAGRRLQAQPLAMTRVVSALLVGLFLATSALAVIASYESTPQYQRMHRMATVEQTTSLTAQAAEVDRVVAAAEAVPGVRRATPVRWVEADCFDGSLPGEAHCRTRAFVGTCAELSEAVPGTTGCRGDTVQELAHGRWLGPDLPAPAALTLWSQGYQFEEPDPTTGSPVGEAVVTGPHGPSAVVPLPSGPTIAVPPWGDGFFGGAVFVPSSLAGVEALLPTARAEIRVAGDPGRDLFEELRAAGLSPGSWEEFSEYDRVVRLRQLVIVLGLVLVGIGMLSFGLAATDRAVERRREVISLQLVGAPGRTLRASQWIEVALPLLLGCTLAVWLGRLVGDTFLALTQFELDLGIAWIQLWPVLTVATTGALLVGLVTSATANPRIRPELIRRE